MFDLDKFVQNLPTDRRTLLGQVLTVREVQERELQGSPRLRRDVPVHVLAHDQLVWFPGVFRLMTEFFEAAWALRWVILVAVLICAAAYTVERRVFRD